VVNGQIVHRLNPVSRRNREEANEWNSRQTVALTGSSWIAVRCWETRAGGRIRFAHSAPWFFDVPNAPLLPRLEEIDFLVQRVREQIERSSGVLPPEAIAEYRKALAIYEAIAERVKGSFRSAD
jgi:hypothetical protein